MKLHEGTARVAFVGQKYAVKLPHPKMIALRIKGCMLDIWDFAQKPNRQNMRVLLDDLTAEDDEIYGFLTIIRGFLENYRERRLSVDPEINHVLIKTYCSLAGIINIQATAHDIPHTITTEELKQLWGKLTRVIIEKRLHHTLFDPINYGVDNEGNVKLRDYGGARIGAFIEMHQAELRALLEVLKKYMY